MKEYNLKINGNDYKVAINEVEDSVAKVEVNGTPFTVEFEQPVAKPKAIKVVKPTVSAAPAVTPAAGRPSAATNAAPAAAASAGGTEVTSPLPGVILDVLVKEGDAVKQGQTVMMLEAMKMENAIEAPADGVVKSINARKGDSVLEGAVLAILG
ncbi:MAG: biotin/lipoyl-binding protein [Bacteroidales bacterium]|nr:biotin/lipoyl-binding protein [Bacteroidales bacterium]MBR5610203.1 biotin/lipoyl-binding protein [Bacteroidales bacterium]